MIDFNEYILNKLNEAENKSPIIIDGKTFKPSEKTSDSGIVTWVDNHIKSLNFKDGRLYYTADDGEQKSSSDSKLIKFYKQQKSNEGSDLPNIDKSDFNKLGKTIAYRSSLCVVKSSGADNFIEAATDVLEDTDDYSINQLGNIENLFGYAAAIASIKELKHKNKKDENKYKDNLNKLKDENTRTAEINVIKTNYKTVFEKHYRIYEQAFNDGLKEMKDEMKKPDFSWEDPATGLKPKGFSEKSAQFSTKAINKLGELGDSIYKKIPAQHTLENDMARVACLVVSGIFKLSKGIAKSTGLLGSIFGKMKSAGLFIGTSLARKVWSKIKGTDVNKRMDEFVKEFEKYEKTKDKNEDETDDKNKTDAENRTEAVVFKGKQFILENKQEDERKQILRKLDSLFYDTIFPYYYYKISNIIYCFENKENMFIFKSQSTDGDWSLNTLNTSNGKLTIIEDNAKLMLNILNDISKKLNKVLKEFGDEPLANSLMSIPNDINYNSNYANEFKKFVDNIQDENNLSLFLNVYNEKIITKKFKTYKDFLNYIETAKAELTKVKGITPLNNKIFEYKEKDLKVNLPGIVDSTKKDETEKEEQKVPGKIEKQAETVVQATGNIATHIADDDLAQKLDKYQKMVDKNTAEVEDWIANKDKNGDTSRNDLWQELAQKLGDVASQIIPRIWRNNKILDLKAKFDETFRQMKLIALLTEKEEQSDNIDKIKEEIKKNINLIDELLNSDESSFTTNYKKWLDQINNIYEELSKNDKLKEELEKLKDKDPLERICLMGNIIAKTHSGEQEEPSGQQETAASGETK